MKSITDLSELKDAEVVPEPVVPKGFALDDQGVWFIGDEDRNGDPVKVFVCSPLEVKAITRNEHNGEFGRLLVWKDSDGHPHRWAMPMNMTAGDGVRLREVLLDGGLIVGAGNKSKQLLTNYIGGYDGQTRALCVNRTGWHGDSFVLPDTVIGNQANEAVILQTTNGGENHFREAGSLQEWREHIARYCAGNSRLVFGTSMAFAAPLLHLLKIEGGGFNFRGGSSEGKSTALRVAASVCGGSEYAHTWRATDNGVEGIAAIHNDALLPFDEMGQIDPTKIGEVAYMLAGGQGKARSDKSGKTRPRAYWRVLLLSTGEISLADHMASAGQTAKAGQEVRLADIPMNTQVRRL